MIVRIPDGEQGTGLLTSHHLKEIFTDCYAFYKNNSINESNQGVKSLNIY